MLITTQPVIIPRTTPDCVYTPLRQWQWTSCQASLRLQLRTASRGLTISAPFTSTVRVWRYWRRHTGRPWTDAPRRGSLSHTQHLPSRASHFIHLLFVVNHQPSVERPKCGNYFKAFRLIFNITTYSKWCRVYICKKIASRRGWMAAAKKKKKVKVALNWKTISTLANKTFCVHSLSLLAQLWDCYWTKLPVTLHLHHM